MNSRRQRWNSNVLQIINLVHPFDLIKWIYLHIMIKVGIIFKQEGIIKFLIQYHFIYVFEVSTPVLDLVLFARSMNVFLNHIIAIYSLIWKQNMCLEQMDSSNTVMSYELDILLFNFLQTQSGNSWTKTNHTHLRPRFNCNWKKIIQDKGI